MPAFPPFLLIGAISPLETGRADFLQCAPLFCSPFLEILLTLKSNFIIYHPCASAHVLFGALSNMKKNFIFEKHQSTSGRPAGASCQHSPLPA